MKVDPTRTHLHGITGIYVRVQDAAGKWGNADIIELDDASRAEFLESRGTVIWPVGTAEVLLRVLTELCDEFDIRASNG